VVSQRLGGDWVVSLDGFLSEEGIFFLLVFEFVVLFFFFFTFSFSQFIRSIPDNEVR